ncbi:hypothetical protein PENTCL1PPCAC_13, partial [Pristionchus entomophagus]
FSKNIEEKTWEWMARYSFDTCTFLSPINKVTFLASIGEYSLVRSRIDDGSTPLKLTIVTWNKMTNLSALTYPKEGSHRLSQSKCLLIVYKF